MRATIGVPEGDRFQIFSEQTGDTLLYDREFLGIERSDDFTLIQVSGLRTYS